MGAMQAQDLSHFKWAIAIEVDEVAVAGHPMYVHHDTLRLAARLADRSDTQTANAIRPQSPTLLLPLYDEYLVGYKSRWLAIDKPFETMAYNKFGIFRPVILHKGARSGQLAHLLGQGCRYRADRAIHQAPRHKHPDPRPCHPPVTTVLQPVTPRTGQPLLRHPYKQRVPTSALRPEMGTSLYHY